MKINSIIGTAILDIGLVCHLGRRRPYGEYPSQIGSRSIFVKTCIISKKNHNYKFHEKNMKYFKLLISIKKAVLAIEEISIFSNSSYL